MRRVKDHQITDTDSQRHRLRCGNRRRFTFAMRPSAKVTGGRKCLGADTAVTSETVQPQPPVNCALVLPLFSLRSPRWRLNRALSPTLVYLLNAGTSKEAKCSWARVQGAKAPAPWFTSPAADQPQGLSRSNPSLPRSQPAARPCVQFVSKKHQINNVLH